MVAKAPAVAPSSVIPTRVNGGVRIKRGPSRGSGKSLRLEGRKGRHAMPKPKDGVEHGCGRGWVVEEESKGRLQWGNFPAPYIAQ